MTRRSRNYLRSLLCGALALAGPALSATAAVPLEKGDTIAIVGSGLADRMQHDGWTETLLQAGLPKHELVIRNLGYTGDSVNHRPRNKGFPSQEEYLKHVKADVIFLMFGYNESFGGENGVSTFKDELGKLVDKYREMKPNGESEPRIVLFTPIAHEDLDDPNLPAGKANNARLAVYSKAVQEVAEARKAGFVDLFSPSAKIFDTANVPLTINGVHLNEEGNRRVGEVIAAALLGKEVPASPSLGKLREAVRDKNWHWHNRFRATDGNDVWGGRSGLKFVDGQSNKDVLWHELFMIDQMVANRDKKVWARAQGGDYTVDDSNVPAPVPVISNVGGGSKSSSAAKEGSLKYIDGEEGLKQMHVAEGMEVNLFADEKRFPELVNPVQMAVDPKGRLWVAAWKTYPKWEPLKQMEDRLLILPDENRDGVADKAITFAKVHNPTGFEFWNGGVLVASQPDILFLKDTDGDDVADVRIRILQGIGSADTHHAANAFAFGPDGAFYWQSGVFFHNAHEHPWGAPLHSGASAMFRFDPRRYAVSVHAGNSPNPHGVCFDGWGYQYANDGTGGRSYQVRPNDKGFKMHQLVHKEVRPVAGSGIISSANFPEEMQGDYILANTIGYLGIKRYKLFRDGYDEAALAAAMSKAWGENPPSGGTELKMADGTMKKFPGDKKFQDRVKSAKRGEVFGMPTPDFLRSDDKNFRPSDVEFGSDGALYISDWHNVIIGHMQHNIRDPNRDHKHGRVYRVTAKGRPLQKDVPIAGAPLAQLMKNLEHPIDGVRYRTRIELSARETKEVIAACKKWLAQFDASSAEHAHHFLEGLWVHQQHNVRDGKLLGQVLNSPNPHAQIAAKTVQHLWYTADPTKGSQAVEEVKEGPREASGVIKDGPNLTEVRVGTLLEQLKYDLTDFKVKAGKKIKLTFKNSDYVPHNIVIVEPGAANPVGEAAIQLGADGFKKNWIPEDDRIIAHSALIDFNQQEVLEFTAPTKPGKYEFVCTFPGHHILMRGVMTVEK